MFQLLDLKGVGRFEMHHVRHILHEELGSNGESGHSISEDVQVWVQIVEELEKDGERPITYEEFYDAISVVMQRGLVDENFMTRQRDRGLRTSIILV